jgi:hypothetical protein
VAAAAAAVSANSGTGGLYITGAYWFTASTSFANPAVTLTRTFTDTFAGIRPTDAPGFMVAQLLGASAVLPEDAHLISTVHDELILDCPADTAEQCRNIAEAAMKEAFVRDVWRHRSRGGRSQGMRQLGEK